MQVQSNVSFQPGREHKVIHPKCKSKGKVPIGSAAWKVEAQKPDESEPNEVIDFAEAQKPRKEKPRWPKVVCDEGHTVTLQEEELSENGGLILLGDNVSITTKGEVVINGLVLKGCATEIVEVQSNDTMTVITYTGKMPSEELVFVLANAQADEIEGSWAQKKFGVYGKEASRSILIDAGEIVILDRHAAIIGDMIISVNENNDIFSYDRKGGAWKMVAVTVSEEIVISEVAAAA